MNSILLRTLQPGRNPSLLAFDDYRDSELNAKNTSVAANGTLLEYETLELRVHPPNVNIDNDTYPYQTLITLDSANRPGTLVEVVQLLTELGLSVTKARISSDGGWFVDEFACADAGKKVTNERKLRAIRKVLSVDADPGGAEGDGFLGGEVSCPASTVFELAGWDRMGLLADVVALLKNNGCEVRSAAVWTANGRCAFVISALEAASGLPVRDTIKLARLRQLLLAMLDAGPAGVGGPGSGRESVVNVATAKGLIHYERRLHQLLLREEEAEWRRQESLAARYEAELAEQQAQRERRWAGSRATTSATVAPAPAGPGPAAAVERLMGGGGVGMGVRPPLMPLRPGSVPQATAAGAVPAPPLSSGMCGLKPAASMAMPQEAAAATAAAAANVTVSASSPLAGSPEGSAHGAAEGINGGGGGGGDGGGGGGGGGAPCSIGPCTSTELGSALSGSASVSSVERPSGPLGPAVSSVGPAPDSSTARATAATAAAPASAASSPHHTLPAVALVPPPSPAPPPAPSASSSAGKPEVWVQHARQHNYWTVSIRCRDRQKLLFDTVCTLADLNYDVFHGAVDCEVERDRGGATVSIALQTFYMRPRFGDCVWDPRRAAKLKYMLEAAIQRRQPTGTKVHIQAAPAAVAAGGGGGDLPSLTAVWRDFGLCISRAKVRALAGAAGEHTFYLVDRNGRPPPDTVVQAACQQIGGVRLARQDGAAASGGGGGAASAAAAAAARGGAGRGEPARFGFVVYSRPGWANGRSSPASSAADSM